jgi:ATP-dependent Clp protease ATP-binding subunit ClpC
MFKRFDASARMVVVTAQEEARGLRHSIVGTEHLLLGVAEQDPSLVGAGPDRLRRVVVARFGTGDAPSPASMPLTAMATRVLELSEEEAAYRGHDWVRAAHLLLVLLREDDDTRAIVQSLGKSVEDVTDSAVAGLAWSPSRPPADIEVALREGHAVPVSLGDDLPIGDLGNPRTDARILLAILMADGPAGKLLRVHGLGEDAVQLKLDPGD